MCGIFAILGAPDTMSSAVAGIKLLQNRGYDSCGVCSVAGAQLRTSKFAGGERRDAVARVEAAVGTGTGARVAIAHTRWATTGRATDANAHPHHDEHDRVAVVHNGIIENFLELKRELAAAGHTFRSETDTEVVAVMIGHYLDLGRSIRDSIQSTLVALAGTWALVVVHRDFPDRMWVTRNGSPLLLSLDEQVAMVASEPVAFGSGAWRYVAMDNHDLIEISKADGGRVAYDIDIRKYEINHKAASCAELHPVGFDFWMEKEMHEQPCAALRAINNGGRIRDHTHVKLGGLDDNRDALMRIDHLVLLGCGTSRHAAEWALGLFRALEIFTSVSVFDAAEFDDGCLPAEGVSGLVLISQSGETKDLHRCLEFARGRELFTVGVVNVVDSLIARETHCGVYLNAGREVGVASTKSFTNQCIVLAMIAVWFSQNRDTHEAERHAVLADLLALPRQIKIVVEGARRAKVLARELLSAGAGVSDHRSMFVLGKGACIAAAQEGALKLKEVAYLHAEGLSSSALKHGPLALITDGVPVVLLDVGTAHRDKNDTCAHEVLARGARLVRVTDRADTEPSDLSIPANRVFGALIANVELQLLSYFAALARGHNPDFPRNLAKCVTVD